DLISDGIGAQVSDTTRETVEAVDRLVAGEKNKRVGYAQLVAELKVDRSAVVRRVRKAIVDGFLINDEDRKGKAARIGLGEPLPNDIEILPDSGSLGGVCSCA